MKQHRSTLLEGMTKSSVFYKIASSRRQGMTLVHTGRSSVTQCELDDALTNMGYRLVHDMLSSEAATAGGDGESGGDVPDSVQSESAMYAERLKQAAMNLVSEMKATKVQFTNRSRQKRALQSKYDEMVNHNVSCDRIFNEERRLLETAHEALMARLNAADSAAQDLEAQIMSVRVKVMQSHTSQASMEAELAKDSNLARLNRLMSQCQEHMQKCKGELDRIKRRLEQHARQREEFEHVKKRRVGLFNEICEYLDDSLKSLHSYLVFLDSSAKFARGQTQSS